MHKCIAPASSRTLGRGIGRQTPSALIVITRYRILDICTNINKINRVKDEINDNNLKMKNSDEKKN